MDIDLGRIAAILVVWAVLGALMLYVAVKGYDAGRLPRWFAALLLSPHAAAIPILPPLALGVHVETDQVLIAIGLFLASFIATRWALAGRRARLAARASRSHEASNVEG